MSAGYYGLILVLYPTGIAKYLPLAVYTTRHLAVSLHPAEDLRNPQEARGVFRPRSGRIGFRREQSLSHAGDWYPEIPNTAKIDVVIPTPKAHAAISKLSDPTAKLTQNACLNQRMYSLQIGR